MLRERHTSIMSKEGVERRVGEKGRDMKRGNCPMP